MTDTAAPDHAVDVPAVLRGGPVDLPQELRVCRIRADERKVKVPWHGGYEHFERGHDTDRDAGGAVVFTWTDRTRVAE